MISETLLIPFRLRTVRVAIGATVLAIGGLCAYGWISSDTFQYRSLFWLTVAVALMGMGIMAVMPWPRLFRGPGGLWLMYAWSMMDIALITLLVVAVGEDHSEVFFIYVLTTIFFAAAAYPFRVQVLMLGFTYVAYLGVLPMAGGSMDLSALIMRLVVLAASAWMSSFLARVLLTQMADHSTARAEADRRAQLMAVVAGAAKQISSLEPDEVLERVIDAAAAMGLEAATVCLFSEDGESYEVRHARGLPSSYSTSVHDSKTGMVGLIKTAGSTIAVDDYSDLDDAIPEIRAQGFRATMGTPLWVDGKMAGVLIAGTKKERVFVPEEVEAFELVASYAGRALENAKRFHHERDALAALAELDRLKGDFISNMSHELRTPLTVISGMAATLDDRWSGMAEGMRVDFLKRIRANANDLHESVLTLLDFSKLASGGLRANLEPIPLRSLFESIAERVNPSMVDHRLEVLVEPGLIVQGDRRFVERVIESLVGNAAQHTPAGTSITLSAIAGPEGAVKISVADNGPGIATEDLRYIGDWFFRGGDPLTRATRGIGLGLALCSKLLESQGSRLDVESEPGTGARFSFTLAKVNDLTMTPHDHAPATSF